MCAQSQLKQKLHSCGMKQINFIIIFHPRYLQLELNTTTMLDDCVLIRSKGM